MTCARCGAPLAPAFPGATIRCTCGATFLEPVPVGAPEVSTLAGSVGPAGPYRAASVRAPDVEAPVYDGFGMPCPRCHGRLVAFGPPAKTGRYVTGGTCECHSCGGVFLDHRQLDEYVQSAKIGIIPDDEPAGGDHAHIDAMYLPCPVCGVRMNRVNFGHRSGVLIDVCREHGTWFDRGELHDALRFAASPAYEEAKARRYAEEAARRADVRRQTSAAIHVSTGEELRTNLGYTRLGLGLTHDLLELLHWTLFRP